MIAFFGRLTTFDCVRLIGYSIAFLAVVGGHDTLHAWGLSDANATTWQLRIASIVAFLTLASNVIKNPSPSKGTSPLLVTSPTPIVLGGPKPIDSTQPPKVVPL